MIFLTILEIIIEIIDHSLSIIKSILAKNNDRENKNKDNRKSGK